MSNIRVFIHQPKVVFRARVNMAVINYPVIDITYDTVTVGSIANVKEGMTLRLGTAAGLDDLGRQRVKSTDAPVISVGRSSSGKNDGELSLADNAYIDVVDEHRVWAKIPYIDPSDGYIIKDNVHGAVFDEGNYTPVYNVQYPRPCANAGGGIAGTIDATSGVLEVDFDGTESFQFDTALSLNLSTVPSYLWDVEDGTIITGTSTSSAITVEFPPGFRYISLTVTSDDGREHTTYVPVFARDPDDDDSLDSIEIVNHIHRLDGQEVSLRVMSDLPRSTYPDGALVMIWEDDLSGPSSIREKMLFVGWIQTEDGSVGAGATGSLRNTTLHCVDILGRLKSLPGFSQRQEALEIADKWYETAYPNMFYYFWYLLYWHSTALEVSGLNRNNHILNTYEFFTLSSDADNLYNQVNGLAQRVTPDHHLLSSYDGQMMLAVDPQILHYNDRNTFVDVICTLFENEYTSVSFTYNRTPRVHKLLTYAIVSDRLESLPIASLAPGSTPGQGEQYMETSERLVLNQFTLNNTEGNRYARLNSRLGMFSITMPWNPDVWDTDYTDLRVALGTMQWVQLSLNAQYQPHRALPFTLSRGILHEINISYDYQETGLVRTATLSWEAETTGPAAETFVLEEEDEE